MIFIYIGSKHAERLCNLMSKFLEESRALIEKIATGKAEDTATKEAVEELKNRLTENETMDAEQETVIKELLQKLATSTPAGDQPTEQPTQPPQ